MRTLVMQVNGQPVSEAIEPRLTLADFLREKCRLTAVHLGCEHGACGACTVVVDGQPTRSCLKLAVQCEGQSIETLEGLRSDETMQVVKKHFHSSHALQCGFCTPGMLIAARDILARNPGPDAQCVRRELSGHVCRCTGYANIIKAIVAAGEELAHSAYAATAAAAR